MSDFLVPIAHRSGGFDRGALGVLSQAARLSAQLGGRADALVIASPELSDAKLAELGAFGASMVFRVSGVGGLSQAVVDAMDAVIGVHGHRYAIFAGGLLGLEAAGGLAARRHGGIVVEVTALRVEQDELIAERPVFGEAELAVARFRGELGVVVARMDAFEAQPLDGAAAARVAEVTATSSPWAGRIELLEQAATNAELGIEEAEVLVAGGRGLGQPEAFALVEELARAFGPGAAVAATRAVVDAGWYPYEHQVGQTGKTVTPKLYIAAGVSGAIQHRVGMSGAENIVAINNDAQAPIFGLADLGVVGDLHAILPKLAAAIRARRGV
jgi:electron transfer flavoprotein alpha subunit